MDRHLTPPPSLWASTPPPLAGALVGAPLGVLIPFTWDPTPPSVLHLFVLMFMWVPGLVLGAIVGMLAACGIDERISVWRGAGVCTLGVVAGSSLGLVVYGIVGSLAGILAGVVAALIFIRAGHAGPGPANQLRTDARWAFAYAATALLATGAAMMSDRTLDRETLRWSLGVDRLPPTVSGVKCIDEGFTDVYTTCTFEIDPGKLDRLLAGRNFSPRRCGRAEPGWSATGRLGGPLQPMYCFTASPPDFEDGGGVYVGVDRERRHGVMHLWMD